MDIVQKHLNTWRTTKHVIGESDCLIRICKYVEDVSGVDNSLGHIGQYSTKQEADSIIERYGSVKDMINLANVTRTKSTARGNIALVKLNGTDEWLPSICTGGGFAFSDKTGVTEINTDYVGKFIAWEVN